MSAWLGCCHVYYEVGALLSQRAWRNPDKVSMPEPREFLSLVLGLQVWEPLHASTNSIIRIGSCTNVTIMRADTPPLRWTRKDSLGTRAVTSFSRITRTLIS